MKVESHGKCVCGHWAAAMGGLKSRKPVLVPCPVKAEQKGVE